MKFRVMARKGTVEETKTVEAETRFEVYAAAEKAGETIVAIEAMSPSPFAGLDFSIGTGVRTEEVINLTKNLAAMLSAGLSLARALSVSARQTKNRSLKRVIDDLEERIKGGTGFHEALAAHVPLFPRFFIAMAKSGEESGTLAESLAIVARQMERTHTLVKKIRGAMIYPAIIFASILVIGILMLVYVVPTLTATFVELGVQLPLSTRIIIGLSQFFITHAFLAILLAIIIVGFIIASLRLASVRAFGVAILLRLPVVGELMRETYTARAASTMASLLSAGVEMLTVLSITEDVVGNRTFRPVIREASRRVEKGETLSSVFGQHTNLFPVLFSEMLAVGEETGKIADMLAQVGEYYENDIETRTKDISTVIEPILMLVVGVAVGIFAISMIGPIYSLTAQIG